MNLRILSKTLVAVAASSVLACAGDNLHPIGEVPCNAGGVCRDKAPVCADPVSSICARNVPNTYGTIGACSYRLINTEWCMCLPGSVQYCSTGAGGSGATLVQDCVPGPGGAQSANWGGCHG